VWFVGIWRLADHSEVEPTRVKPPTLPDQYLISLETLNAEQSSYFAWLVGEIAAGRRPRVRAQFGYLLLYVSQLLRRWRRLDLDATRLHLLGMAEAYCDEPKFAAIARTWAQDCRLARGEFRAFLDESEPNEVFVTDTHRSNLRCNVAYHLGLESRAIDLFRMSSVSVTPYTRTHPAKFVDFLEEVLAENVREGGPWLERLIVAGRCERIYRHSVFQGGGGGPELPFQMFCFYTGVEVLKAPIREAEQRLRDVNKMPRIGEGWLRETELFYLIKEYFRQTEVIQHGRPSWLAGQHLDVWIPEWRVAVEYHGEQHYRPVEYFGGEQAFAETRSRDARKERLCMENDVMLLVVREEDDRACVLSQIEARAASSARSLPSAGSFPETR
jgi:hypothetical protein